MRKSNRKKPPSNNLRTIPSKRANSFPNNAPQLRYYDISAPFPGVVGDIPVKVGDYVAPSTQLLTITVNQPMEAYIYVPVEKSRKLRPGMLVELIAPDGRELGPSHVFFVAPRAEGADQTVLIKAEYSNSDGRVRVGEWGQARIVWSQDSGLWVPTTAVTQLAGQNFRLYRQTGKRKMDRPSNTGEARRAHQQ